MAGGLIEACGTGMRKIMNAYKKADKKPIIENTSNAFRVTLPNINTQYETKEREESKKVSFLLRRMVDRGALARQGNSRNIKYTL